MKGDRDGSDVGLRTIIPAWLEITEYMESFPELTIADRLDIVDQVFERTVQDYVKFVRNERQFGDVTEVLYTIKFHKEGLPHCHLLIWISEATKIPRYEDVDRFISAELSDLIEEPKGHRVFSEFMMHGPCGLANQSAPCMQEGSLCSKNFPKIYCDETYIDKDGYVHYKRRNTDGYTDKQNFQLDNNYVVPYNRELCMSTMPISMLNTMGGQWSVQSLDPFDRHSDFGVGSVQSLDPFDRHSDFGA
ncbi:DNA helicase, partial [Tanacetum coccineum]